MTTVPFPQLIERVIQQESGGNPNAVSPVGAAGLMQIMPATAADPGYGVAPLNWDLRFDPAENKRFGTDYLSALIDHFGGDQERALVAYNWGAGNAAKWNGDRASLPEETRNYLAAILGQGAPTAAQRPQARPDVLPPPPGLAPATSPVPFARPQQPAPAVAQAAQPAAPVNLAALLRTADEAQTALAMLPR